MAGRQAVIGLGVDSGPAEQGVRVWKRAGAEIRKDARKTDAEVRRFDASLDQLGPTLGRFHSHARNSNRFFTNIARGAASAGAAVAGLLVGPLVRLGVALGGIAGGAVVVRTFAAFEDRMARVQAVTRATTKDFVQLQQQARDLGASTKFSASEAAEGMEFLGRAGFSTAKIIGAMPGLLDLSAAAALGLGRAADITSNIMSAFAIPAEESSRIADALAASAANANTDVSQMGEAMKYVGPVARALGISMEDSAAGVGVLSNAGLQASVAGTGLRRILSELASPSSKAESALAALGVTVEELDPRTVSLVDIVQRLADAELDAASAFEIFGDRGAPAILALTSQASDLERLTGVINESEGTARRMADTMNDTLVGSFKNLESALEEDLLRVGEEVVPVLREIVDGTTEFLRNSQEGFSSFGEFLASSISGAGVVLQKLGVALDVVKTAVVGFVAAWATASTLQFGAQLVGWIAYLLQMSRALQGGVASMTLWTAATNAATAAWGRFTAALAKNPVTLVAVAVGVLAAATYRHVKAQQDARKENEAYLDSLRQNRLEVRASSEELDDLAASLREEIRLRERLRSERDGAVTQLADLERIATTMREALDAGDLTAYREAAEAARELGVAIRDSGKQSAYQAVLAELAEVRLQADAAADDFEASAGRVEGIESRLSASASERLEAERQRQLEYRAILTRTRLQTNETEDAIADMWSAGGPQYQRQVDQLKELQTELAGVKKEADAARIALALSRSESFRISDDLYQQANRQFAQGNFDAGAATIRSIADLLPEGEAERIIQEQAAINAAWEETVGVYIDLQEEADRSADALSGLRAALAEERRALEAQLESWKEYGEVTVEVQAKIEAREALLRAEIEPTDALVASIAELIAQNLRYQESLDELEEAEKRSIERKEEIRKKIDEIFEAAGKQIKANREYIDDLTAERIAEEAKRSALYRSKEAYQQVTIAQEVHARIKERGNFLTKEEAAVIEREVRALFAARQEIEELNDAYEESERRAEQALSALQQPLENFIRGSQEALTGFFQGILDGEIDSWKDFFGEITDLFKRMLAEWAAYALTKTVVVNVAAAFGAGGGGGGGNGGGSGGGIWTSLLGSAARYFLGGSGGGGGGGIWSSLLGLFGGGGAPAGAAYYGGGYTGALASLGNTATSSAAVSTTAATVAGALATVAVLAAVYYIGDMMIERHKAKLTAGEIEGGSIGTSGYSPGEIDYHSFVHPDGFGRDDELGRALGSAARELQGILREVEILTQGALNLTEEFSIRVKKDGRIWVNIGQRISKEFDEMSDAIQYAALELLRTAELTGDQVPDAVRQALANTAAATLEELMEDLQFALSVAELDMSPAERTFQQLWSGLQRMLDDAERLGIDATPIYRKFSEDLAAWRDEIVGIERDEFQERLDMADDFNTTIAAKREQYEAELQELQQILLVLERNAEQAEILGESLGGLGGDLAGLGRDAATTGVLVGQSAEEIRARMAELEALLGTLPELIGDGEVSRGGGGRGQRRNDRERLDEILEQHELAQLSDFDRALAELNRRWDEAAELAHGNAEQLERVNAAREREIQQLHTDRILAFYEDLRGFEGIFRGGFEAALQGIKDDAEALRGEVDELEIGADRAAAALARIDRAERARIEALGREVIASLGAPSQQTREELGRVAASLAFLREHMEELGLTAEDLAAVTREVGDQMFLGLVDGLNQFVQDEEVRRDLEQIRYQLTIANYELQFQLLQEMGLLTAEQIAMVQGLLDRLPEEAPTLNSGYRAPRYNGPSGPDPYEERLRAREEIFAQIAAWEALGQSAAFRELATLFERLEELEELATKAHLAQSELNRLQAAYDNAVEDFWDRTLEPYENRTLYDQLAALEQEFYELARAAELYGGDLERIEAARQTAVEDFWKEVLGPLRDYRAGLERSAGAGLKPEERVAALRGEIESVAAAAAGGDLEAIQQLPQLLEALRTEALSAYGIGGGYQDALDYIRLISDQILGLEGSVEIDPEELAIVDGVGQALDEQTQALLDALAAFHNDSNVGYGNLGWVGEREVEAVKDSSNKILTKEDVADIRRQEIRNEISKGNNILSTKAQAIENHAAAIREINRSQRSDIGAVATEVRQSKAATVSALGSNGGEVVAALNLHRAAFEKAEAQNAERVAGEIRALRQATEVEGNHTRTVLGQIRTHTKDTADEIRAADLRIVRNA